MSMRVLFLGGTGVISSAVVKRALAQGLDVTVVNRGRTTARPVPEGVRSLNADVHDPEAFAAVLGEDHFDAAVSFVGYSPQDVDAELSVLSGRVDQYVFLSTCSVYAHPAPLLPIRESSPRRAPKFDYPANKIRCEEALEQAYRRGVPVTIVRPSHVYDRTSLPVLSGWTAVQRFREGKAVVVHGDGTSLWNVMHADDFAAALLPLIGNPRAIGEQFHITSETPVSWDEIHLTLARAAGVSEPRLVHKSSADIGAEIDWMDVVLGEDFRHSVIYDNSRFRLLAPGFSEQRSLLEGLRESVQHFDAHPGLARVDASIDAAFDRLSGLTVGAPSPLQNSTTADLHP